MVQERSNNVNCNKRRLEKEKIIVELEHKNQQLRNYIESSEQLYEENIRLIEELKKDIEK